MATTSKPVRLKPQQLKEKHLKEGQEIQCIQNDSKLRIEIHLNCLEFTWNCPNISQPDYGTIYIIYTPDKKVIETKSLKFYLQRYRYKNAFNEELCHRILSDLLYYVQPIKIEVKLLQNSRGGITNTSIARWDSALEK